MGILTDQMRQRQPVKNHLELTTGSLMARRSQWAFLAEDLVEGSLLVVVPRGGPKTRTSLTTVARRFNERGGKALIHYWS